MSCLLNSTLFRYTKVSIKGVIFVLSCQFNIGLAEAGWLRRSIGPFQEFLDSDQARRKKQLAKEEKKLASQSVDVLLGKSNPLHESLTESEMARN